ncbi:O-antigen ligase family protein [bacterium]|nr:O-antigen ligase family protein [bacterium]
MKQLPNKNSVHNLTLCVQVLAGIMLFIAIIGHVNISLLPLMNKIIGLLMIGFVIPLFQRKTVIPPEVFLYFAFILWAFLAGLTVAVDTSIVLEKTKTLVQFGIYFGAVAVAHSKVPRVKVTLIITFLIGAVLIGISYYWGSVSNLGSIGERLDVLSINPNGLAEIWIFSVLSALFFIRYSKNNIVRVCLLMSLPIFSAFILLTGSRKMFVGLVIVFAVWSFLTYFRHARYAIIYISFVSVVSFFFLDYATNCWNESVTRKRFQQLEEPRYRDGLAIRQDLYKEGWVMFRDNPFTGVGLGNYQLLSTYRVVSHSDYAEVLSTTGIIGAFLYFPIYLVLGRRLYRLRKIGSEQDAAVYYYYVTIFVLLLFLMTGFSHFGNMFLLYLLGTLSGYALNGVKELRKSYPK